MEWIKQLMVMRRANESNVFLLETDDLIRIRQLIYVLLKSGSDFGFRIKRGYDRLSGNLRFEEVEPDVIEVDVLARKATRYSRSGDRVSKQNVEFTGIFRHGMARPVAYVVHYIYREDHGRMLADTLMSLSNNEEYYLYRSTVFVFTYSRHLFPASLLSFVPTIRIQPTDDEKKKIVEELYGKYGVNPPKGIIESLRGLNLKETETVILKALSTGEPVENIILTHKAEKFENIGIKLQYPRLGLERIGGYEVIKNYLEENIIAVMENIDKAVKYGIGVPKGILFVGPPGTGKTVFSKALAAELKIPFLELQASKIFSKYVGETEAKVETITTLANEVGPSILFVDEAEQVFQSRVRTYDSGVSIRATAMLLSALGREDRKFMLFMTANFPEMLDEALVRRGRIDAVIPILYPDTKAREAILKVHLSVVRKIPTRKLSLRRIAEKTHWWTGAELEALVVDVAKKALLIKRKDYVEQEDFEEAISKVKINIDARREYMEKFIDNIQSALRNAPIVTEIYESQMEILGRELEIESAKTLL